MLEIPPKVNRITWKDESDSLVEAHRHTHVDCNRNDSEQWRVCTSCEARASWHDWHNRDYCEPCLELELLPSLFNPNCVLHYA